MYLPLAALSINSLSRFIKFFRCTIFIYTCTLGTIYTVVIFVLDIPAGTSTSGYAFYSAARMWKLQISAGTRTFVSTGSVLSKRTLEIFYCMEKIKKYNFKQGSEDTKCILFYWGLSFTFTQLTAIIVFLATILKASWICK